MKNQLISMCLLVSSAAFAQKTEDLDLGSVSSLMQSKASPTEVMKSFALSPEEYTTPDYTILKYKSEGKDYMFRFSGDRKLTDFSYTNSNENQFNEASYSVIRHLVHSSKKDLLHKLGTPAMITIHGNTETWSYRIHQQKGKRKMLAISFDVQTSDVKSYNFCADNDVLKTVSSDMLTAFKKGITKIEEIEKALGEPSKLIVTQNQEEWYYISADSRLVVYFDAKSHLTNYLFEHIPQH